MKDIIFDDFQNCVNESLLRHKSILDITTKHSDAHARVNRAVVKAVTDCGCISINAKKQYCPLEDEDEDITKINKCLKSHVSGKLCNSCRDVLERELGNELFYITSLCDVLGLNLYDILIKEYNTMQTLGKYTFR